MTIRDLNDQFEIQGAFCVKVWKNDLNDCVVFAEGKDFESDKWKLSERCLDSNIEYMYAIDGILHIEIE